MTSSEMLEIRNWLEGLVKAAGGRVTGAGVNMQEPVADFDFTKDTRAFNVSIRFRGEQQG